MNDTIRILHVEDNPEDSLLVRALLEKANVKFDYCLVDCDNEFQAFLKNKTFDLILSDFHLPGYSGSEALHFAKNNFPNIPFVFLSGTMGEDTAIDSLLNGATDYVLKNKMERLVPAIYRAFKESKAQKARINAEKALLQSEENFRRSITESPLGIRIVNLKGETIFANQKFLDIYEFSNLKEYIETPARLKYTPESFQLHLERKELRQKGLDVLEYELSIFRKNGEIRHVKILRNEVLWDGIKHYQVINQDITDQKKLTAELIAAKEKAEESDRLKSAFLANMSHEIRTPMNGILGFSSLLSEPGLEGEEMSEYITIIQKSGNRMLNIINEIIDISKIEAGLMEVNLEETHVNEQIELIFNLFKPDADIKNIDIRFSNSLPSDKALIHTDKEKLLSILTNLVKNAIKYTETGNIEIGYVPVLSPFGNAELEFFVRDTGIGIPYNRQDAIFERFVQADIADVQARQGSGLGLTISKAYVEMLKGRIWVKSEPGKGSLFCFTLPLSNGFKIEIIQEQEDLPIVKDSQVNQKLSGLSILIVEDDEISGKLLSTIVTGITQKVLTTISGDEAIQIMFNNPDIDLVLMDIRMPGTNGYEATRKIRQFNKKVVIIAQTAYGMTGDREKSIEAGCDDWISKPISKDALKLLIHKYFYRV